MIVARRHRDRSGSTRPRSACCPTGRAASAPTGRRGRMARPLAGQFAGIVHFQVPAENARRHLADALAMSRRTVWSSPKAMRRAHVATDDESFGSSSLDKIGGNHARSLRASRRTQVGIDELQHGGSRSAAMSAENLFGQSGACRTGRPFRRGIAQRPRKRSPTMMVDIGAPARKWTRTAGAPAHCRPGPSRFGNAPTGYVRSDNIRCGRSRLAVREAPGLSSCVLTRNDRTIEDAESRSTPPWSSGDTARRLQGHRRVSCPMCSIVRKVRRTAGPHTSRS
jgi:hypothetical protein